MKTFIDVAGWTAAVFILGAYGLVSSGKIAARSPLYQWLNIIGALGFIINCSWNGVWPSVGLNVAWLGIGVYALLALRRKRTADQPG